MIVLCFNDGYFDVDFLLFPLSIQSPPSLMKQLSLLPLHEDTDRVSFKAETMSSIWEEGSVCVGVMSAPCLQRAPFLRDGPTLTLGTAMRNPNTADQEGWRHQQRFKAIFIRIALYHSDRLIGYQGPALDLTPSKTPLRTKTHFGIGNQPRQGTRRRIPPFRDG